MALCFLLFYRIERNVIRFISLFYRELRRFEGMSRPRILIYGAGIGGLALAQGLRRRHIYLAVFERDSLLDSRLQGYRIKIFAEMKEKLRGTLLEEAWLEFETTCARTMLGETNLNATDAAILACRKGHLPEGADLPYTADRGLLRRMMTGIEDSVHFGKQYARYEIKNDQVEVVFLDGSVEKGTFVVGADGSRSAIRKQFLPDFHFLDTDGCCIYCKSFMNTELSTRFPEKHRKWITVIRDETPIIQSIISGVCSSITMVTEPVEFPSRGSRDGLPQDYVHWGLLFSKSSCGLGEKKFNEALRSNPSKLALEITSQWHPSIRSLLELRDVSLTSGMRVYSYSPEMQMWEPSPHVTVLGDAIHLMSPSGGVGAVAALNDAAALAQIIADDQGSPSVESIEKYEQMMREFASACLRRSFTAGEKMLNMPAAEKCKMVDL